jgi:hypothetical protein
MEGGNKEACTMRDIRSIGVGIVVVALNALAMFELGFSVWMLPLLMTSLLLVLEATPDPA